jgi:hypothetical protein
MVAVFYYAKNSWIITSGDITMPKLEVANCDLKFWIETGPRLLPKMMAAIFLSKFQKNARMNLT